ncbi:NAD-dependent epimerase/dehydratase family protein [Jeotgalibacillus sp. S-D1]|nr:NAD-dependent epimerase/dehydratase family protein [Jeotgalibacillus sp. S-D1]
MNKRTALVIGATGLVGQEVVKELCSRDEYGEVRIISRKPIEMEHEKLTVSIIDFNYLEGSHIGVADDVFCCLGTTMKKAKSKAAFRQVDLDFPLQLASLAKKNNARQFLVISAMGADLSSTFYYNRIKGLMEEQLIELDLPHLQIFRPSLLLGDRKEFRLGETVGAKVMSAMSWALVGPLKSLKAVRAEQVALAMVEGALAPSVEKVKIHLSSDIEKVEKPALLIEKK